MVLNAQSGARRSFSVRFCGAQAGRGILAMPEPEDWQELAEGTPLRVKVFNGRYEIGFASILQKQISQPARCWMLAYPESINSRAVRAAHRVPIAMEVELSTAGSTQRWPALGLDISVDGMQVAADQIAAGAGQRLRILFSVKVDGREWSIERDASICHARADSKTGLHHMGALFAPDADRESRLAMQRFIEQRLAWLKCA